MRIEAEPGIGELGQVELADRHHAGRRRVGDAGEVGGLCRPAGEELRAGGGRRAGDVEQVLPADRHAVERRQRRADLVASLSLPGLRPRAGGSDGDEDVVALRLGDALEQAFGQLDGAGLARAVGERDARCGPVGDVFDVAHVSLLLPVRGGRAAFFASPSCDARLRPLLRHRTRATSRLPPAEIASGRRASFENSSPATPSRVAVRVCRFASASVAALCRYAGASPAARDLCFLPASSNGLHRDTDRRRRRCRPWTAHGRLPCSSSRRPGRPCRRARRNRRGPTRWRRRRRPQSRSSP